MQSFGQILQSYAQTNTWWKTLGLYWATPGAISGGPSCGSGSRHRWCLLRFALCRFARVSQAVSAGGDRPLAHKRPRYKSFAKLTQFI